MPKIVIESGLVINMGGYIIENMANLDCVDVVVGNPTEQDLKVIAPVYDKKTLEEYEKMGLIVEYIYVGDNLREKLEQVKTTVTERLKGNDQ